MKLYYSGNLNPRVAVAVARHLGSPVDYILTSPRRPDQAQAFLAINPNGLVPVLDEGASVLWETDAIACRLSALAGSDFWRTDAAQPQMIQWISWSTHHLSLAASVLYWENVVKPTFSGEAAPPGVIAEALDDFRRHASVLDSFLGGRTWLVGDRLSYADFRAATALPFARQAGLPLDEFENMKRWHDRLCEIDAWRAPFEGLPAASGA